MTRWMLLLSPALLLWQTPFNPFAEKQRADRAVAEAVAAEKKFAAQKKEADAKAAADQAAAKASANSDFIAMLKADLDAAKKAGLDGAALELENKLKSLTLQKMQLEALVAHDAELGAAAIANEEKRLRDLARERGATLQAREQLAKVQGSRQREDQLLAQIAELRASGKLAQAEASEQMLNALRDEKSALLAQVRNQAIASGRTEPAAAFSTPTITTTDGTIVTRELVPRSNPDGTVTYHEQVVTRPKPATAPGQATATAPRSTGAGAAAGGMSPGPLTRMVEEQVDAQGNVIQRNVRAFGGGASSGTAAVNPAAAPQYRQPSMGGYYTASGQNNLLQPAHLHANPWLSPDLRKVAEAETKSFALAREIQGMPPGPPRDVKRTELTAMLNVEFQLKLAAHEKSIKDLEERLAKAKELAAKRTANKDKIIAERLSRLLNERSEFDWDQGFGVAPAAGVPVSGLTGPAVANDFVAPMPAGARYSAPAVMPPAVSPLPALPPTSAPGALRGPLPALAPTQPISGSLAAPVAAPVPYPLGVPAMVNQPPAVAPASVPAVPVAPTPTTAPAPAAPAAPTPNTPREVAPDVPPARPAVALTPETERRLAQVRLMQEKVRLDEMTAQADKIAKQRKAGTISEEEARASEARIELQKLAIKEAEILILNAEEKARAPKGSVAAAVVAEPEPRFAVELARIHVQQAMVKLDELHSQHEAAKKLHAKSMLSTEALKSAETKLELQKLALQESEVRLVEAQSRLKKLASKELGR
jgi:hypothetical protein